MIAKTLIAAAGLALAANAAAQPAAAPAPRPASSTADWRTPDADDLMIIDTNKGRIIVEIVPEVAPATAERVKALTRLHFYDGLTFFRVIDDFMAQTGDPKNDGSGESELPNLAQEFTFRQGAGGPFVMVVDQTVLEHGFIKSMPIRSQSSRLAIATRDGKVQAMGLFCKGTAGMARAAEPDTGNSQFYLMRENYPRLDGRYTPWGRIISGQEVVKSIKTGEPVADPRDRMTTVRLASELKAADRPKVRVIDPASAWFKAEAVRIATEKGPAFTACDIDIPAEVK
jgi:peptidylprolyl isomerase